MELLNEHRGNCVSGNFCNATFRLLSQIWEVVSWKGKNVGTYEHDEQSFVVLNGMGRAHFRCPCPIHYIFLS